MEKPRCPISGEAREIKCCFKMEGWANPASSSLGLHQVKWFDRSIGKAILLTPSELDEVMSALFERGLVLEIFSALREEHLNWAYSAP